MDRNRSQASPGCARRAYEDDSAASDFQRSGRAARSVRPNCTCGTAPNLVLAAADPANPYGAALPWPRHGDDDRRPLPRAAGAYVVLHDGDPVLYLERGGRSLLTLPAAAESAVAEAVVRALAGLVGECRVRALELARVDGAPVADSPLRDLLAAVALRASYRGWVLRAQAR